MSLTGFRRGSILQANAGRALFEGSVPSLALVSLLTGQLFCQSAAAPAADGEWAMPAHDYASTRFSDLTEITAANVGDLTVQYTFSMGVSRGQEAAPLVVNNTMYLVAPYPNELFAL